MENVAQKIGYIEGLQAMLSSLTIFRSSPTLSLLVIRKICVFSFHNSGSMTCKAFHVISHSLRSRFNFLFTFLSIGYYEAKNPTWEHVTVKCLLA